MYQASSLTVLFLGKQRPLTGQTKKQPSGDATSDLIHQAMDPRVLESSNGWSDSGAIFQTVFLFGGNSGSCFPICF